MRVALKEVHLRDTAPLERGLPLSTLIRSEEYQMEGEWDGHSLGDVHLYRCSPKQLAFYRERIKQQPDTEGDYTKGDYFGTVPQSLVKCYRFLDGEPGSKPAQTSIGKPAPATSQR